MQQFQLQYNNIIALHSLRRTNVIVCVKSTHSNTNAGRTQLRDTETHNIVSLLRASHDNSNDSFDSKSFCLRLLDEKGSRSPGRSIPLFAMPLFCSFWRQERGCHASAVSTMFVREVSQHQENLLPESKEYMAHIPSRTTKHGSLLRFTRFLIL